MNDPVAMPALPSPATSVQVPSGVFIGTHYEYPFGGNSWRSEWRPRSPADWRRDLRAIADTGFNLVRIRVGFDSILDDVEIFLDIADKLGLKVDFGFATFYAPDWFMEQHPDARMVNADGETLGQPGDRRWPRACIEHPAFRETWRNLLECSALRFADHPAIVLWDVHNEPKHICYCARSRANFEAYLSSRYGTIDQLNARWSTNYADFKACTGPPQKREGGPGMGVESHYGAWRAFQTEVLTSFLAEGFSLIRSHVTKRPVTYNVVLSLDHGSDWWVTQTCDIAALSEYWGSDAWTANRSARLALLAGLNPGKQLWALETQGGPGPKYFTPTLWTGKHLELETWALLGRGVRGIVQYRWDPLLCENEAMMLSLVDIDRYDTERRRTMASVNARIRELEPLLAAARRPPPQVFIYLPRETYVRGSLKYPATFNVLPLGYTPSATLDGWYGLLVHSGFSAAVLCQLSLGLSNELTILVPFTEFLTDAEWHFLSRFSKSGGRVVFQLPDRDGCAAKRVAQILDLKADQVEVRSWDMDGWALFEPGGMNVGAAYTKRVSVDDVGSHRIIAKFHDNGEPAILERADGRVLITAFDVGLSYDLMLHRTLRQRIAKWISDRGTTPLLRLEGIEEDYRPFLEVNLLCGKSEDILVCCNRSPYAWDTVIRVLGHEPVSINLPSSGARQIILPRSPMNRGA